MVTPTAPPQPPAVAGGQARSIPIDQIVVGERLRPLNPEVVNGLAIAIQADGLIHPISVRPVGDGYQLVAGHHRLEAAKRIGWTDIPATVRDIDATEAQLIEINENLIRKELSVLQQAEHLKRSKEIYEAQHPESIRTGRRRKNAGTVPTFSEDAARKTGKDESTIRRYVRIASRLTDEVRDLLHSTEVSNQTRQLDQLSRCTDPSMQLEIAKALVSGNVKTVAAARRFLTDDAPPTADRGATSESNRHALATPHERENLPETPVEPGDAAVGQECHGSGDPGEPTASIRQTIDLALGALLWDDITRDQFIAMMACLARPCCPVDELHAWHLQLRANRDPLFSLSDLELASIVVAHPESSPADGPVEAGMDEHAVPQAYRDPSNPDNADWDYSDEDEPTIVDESSPEGHSNLRQPRQACALSEWMAGVLPGVEIEEDNAQRLWEKSGRNWRLLAAALIVAREFGHQRRLTNPGGYIYSRLQEPEQTETRASRVLEKRPTWAPEPLIQHSYTEDELVWVIGNIRGRWRDLPDLSDEQAASLLDVADGDFGHVLDAIQGIYWRSKHKAVPDPIEEIRQALALEAREVEAMGRGARHFAGQPGIEHLNVPTLGTRLLAERGLERRDIWNYWDEESNPDRDTWGTELAAQLTRQLRERERGNPVPAEATSADCELVSTLAPD